MSCVCEDLRCPHCGQPVRVALVPGVVDPAPVAEDDTPTQDPTLITDAEVPETPQAPPPPERPDTVKTFNVRTPITTVPAAPDTWTLPMAFREHNPWGYLHGQLNERGQLHPGYDLNNGNTAHADLGEPIYAPRPGTVVYAKRTPGWGTLLAVLMDEEVDGRRVCYRIGHPDRFVAPWGAHVEAGQLIAVCGDGKMPDRYTPHLHYDIVDIEVLWEVTQDRGIGKPDLTYYGQGMNRELFDRLYLDPRHFHPEIDQALTRVGK